MTWTDGQTAPETLTQPTNTIHIFEPEATVSNVGIVASKWRRSTLETTILNASYNTNRTNHNHKHLNNGYPWSTQRSNGYPVTRWQHGIEINLGERQMGLTMK